MLTRLAGSFHSSVVSFYSHMFPFGNLPLPSNGSSCIKSLSTNLVRRFVGSTAGQPHLKATIKRQNLSRALHLPTISKNKRRVNEGHGDRCDRYHHPFKHNELCFVICYAPAESTSKFRDTKAGADKYCYDGDNQGYIKRQ